jgi:hypothetical protein
LKWWLLNEPLDFFSKKERWWKHNFQKLVIELSY